MQNNILITSFSDSSICHGGFKRSSQLREEFEKLGYKVVRVDISKKNVQKLMFSNFISFIWHVAKWFILTFNCKINFKGIVCLSVIEISLHRFFKLNGVDLVALEVSHSLNMLVGYVLKHYNVPYVCFPHNIEFLVPGQDQIYFKSYDAALKWELKIYQSAKHVFAISKFDCAVLKCFKISTSLFEYYPASLDNIFLSTVSLNRENLQKGKYFLVIGTIYNYPTLQGMNYFLNLMSSSCVDIKVVLAGFGTEIFNKNPDTRIVVKGAVSDAELVELYSNAYGVIITQVQTSGFLTKIVELNLCSIPMFLFSSYMQAEHLEEYGVYSVCKIEDLLDIYDSNVKFNIKKFNRPNLCLKLIEACCFSDKI